MGQYHHFATLDQGYSISPHLFGSGNKLREFTSGGYGNAMSCFGIAISPVGPLFGDRVVIIGDYARPGDLADGLPFAEDPNELYDAKAPKGMVTKLRSLVTAHTKITPPDELDDPRDDEDLLFEVITNPDPDPVFGDLYVVNKDTNEYLDPHHFGSGRNLAALIIRPSSTLLATAYLLALTNGRGGGDYATAGPHPDLIGSWGACRVAITTRSPTGTDISHRVSVTNSATPSCAASTLTIAIRLAASPSG